MDCDEVELIIEDLVDGSIAAAPAAALHLEGCAACQSRLDRARAIERLLMTRDVPAPPPTFTSVVMSRIVRELWAVERAVDIGFNLALAAGALVIVAGVVGLAWSLGFLTIAIDVDALLRAAGPAMSERLFSEVQTLAMAATVLTMALVLWWWAEADSSL
jgi:hypothetical protein